MNLQIPIIELKNIPNIIKYCMVSGPNILTIYHIIIGSRVDKYSLTTEDIKLKRNHECPKIIQQLLLNPEQQFSPEFIHYLSISNFKDFTIRNVLFLIDETYKITPEPIGLLHFINNNNDIFANNDNICLTRELIHNEFNKTIITSILEPYLVPENITEIQVQSILQLISSLGVFYPNLINIIDCSSFATRNIFKESIDNNNNQIHITQPKCLLLDNEEQYNPIITYNSSNSKSINDDDVKNKIVSDDTFDNTKISVRWINYDDDKYIVDDLKAVSDYCQFSKNTYNFITILYKRNCIESSLYSLYKLWGYTTFTSNYEINLVDHNLVETNKTIIINISKLGFDEFATYWINPQYSNFKELSVFKYDYDYIIIKKYITKFLLKYINHEGISYLGLNPSIIDIIKYETFEIFKFLGKYFPEYMKYVPDNSSNISRVMIKDFLNENDVIF